jgi:hypothetical protein
VFQQQLSILDDDHLTVEEVGMEDNQPMLIESKYIGNTIISAL